jgi:hypothetical protein
MCACARARPNELARKNILEIYLITVSVITFIGFLITTLSGARGSVSWLWHCATSRNVSGTFPDKAIGFFG